LADDAVVTVKTVGQTEEPGVDGLLGCVQRGQKLIDHLVVEAEEERFIKMVLKIEIVR
jgi:hypothetical protein